MPVRDPTLALEGPIHEQAASHLDTDDSRAPPRQ
jgi:hypothetical protein